MAGEGGVGGDAYSSWCPTTWVDAEADAQVGGHVSGHTVGGAHNASWESSAVPELPSLPDLWMSSLTDSASSAEEDNIKRDAPSSPPLEPPKSPPNDNTVCKLELKLELSHDSGMDDGSLPWIDSDMTYPWPQAAITMDATLHQDDSAWHPVLTYPRPPKTSRNGTFEDLKLQNSWRTGLGGTAPSVTDDVADSARAPVQIPKPTTSKAPRSPKVRKEGSSPRARGASTPKGDSLSYEAMLKKMPPQPDEKSLLSIYLRDELRSLLKRNGISYHKPGRANLMKSKSEMAADLISLLSKGMKTPEQVRLEDEQGASDQASPRARKNASGGSGSPRRKVAPKVTPAVPPSPSLKKKAAVELDAEAEFRKRVKVALT